MEPLNKQERTEAFLKMLALFLLIAVLMAIPMYYAFRLPWKNCKDVQSKLDSKIQLEKEFLIKTDSAKNLYNRFETEYDDLERAKTLNQYSTISIDMGKFTTINNIETVNSKLYSNVLFSYDQLFQNQKTVFNLQDSIYKILHPKKIGTEVEPVPIPPTHIERMKELVKEALKIKNNDRNQAGNLVGLSKKTFAAVMKELGINDQ